MGLWVEERPVVWHANIKLFLEVAVAQLAERLLPIPEVCGSRIQSMAKIILNICSHPYRL